MNRARAHEETSAEKPGDLDEREDDLFLPHMLAAMPGDGDERRKHLPGVPIDGPAHGANGAPQSGPGWAACHPCRIASGLKFRSLDAGQAPAGARYADIDRADHRGILDRTTLSD
jgi:hypothetical protein